MMRDNDNDSDWHEREKRGMNAGILKIMRWPFIIGTCLFILCKLFGLPC